MGRTLPRSVISPVMATERLTGRPVKTEIIAVAIVMPADGPSAGITMATAILSVLTNRPIKRALAMTGEITLRGNVLPIGGLKEKILAARRAGITTVICPKLNRKELDEIPAVLRRGIQVHLVDTVEDVLRLALIPGLETRPVGGHKPVAKPLPPKSRTKTIVV